jgi:ABC-type uncharacterized transport system permease subunit
VERGVVAGQVERLPPMMLTLGLFAFGVLTLAGLPTHLGIWAERTLTHRKKRKGPP